MTISIIGSGKVGASIALNCGLRELDSKINLVDIIEGLPQGEAMDINHQLSVQGLDSDLIGTNDFSVVRDSKIVILVAGVGRKPGMTRMDLLKTNASIVKDVATKISQHNKNAILIVVTNPLDPMTYLALKTTKYPKNKVMGMGGMLDLSRFASFIHEYTKLSRESISAMVISEHGEKMLPLIRFSSISGIPLNNFINENQSNEIYEKTKQVAAEVIKLKGATVYAPGNAVATMTEAIIKDKKSVIPLSAYLEGEFGVNDVCIGVPAVVGKDGIEKIVELPLNDFERQEFEKGIQNVREAISSLPL
ncbi:malate dehydrogenase [Candidatus Nitrosocosmicus sp.]|jgi:malate dehydrogenase|uniref:malate dehydrogenase n=1 Tax=Candidatus Nitrosocosmicus sp. FF01 TaxID=3397670 RepID=UPI002ACC8889|nr:malate dehydrogenase [Candidatus Nitrosocosmicus sp.]